MLTLLIAVVLGSLVGTYIGNDLHSPVWGVICGIVLVCLIQLVIGLILRRKVMQKQQQVQQIMVQAQGRAERQLALYQQRQPGNLSGAKQLANKFQREAAKEALEAVEGFRSFYKWSPMLYRHVNTMKAQLYFQLHEFKTVDELLKKSFLADAQSLAIMMTRMFRNQDAGLDKFYAKKCRKAKGEAGAFLACVYGWIKLQQGNEDAARDALTAAAKLSDHPVLLENLDKLRNGKVKHFSNHVFGDVWFALELEELKVKPQRMRQARPY